MFLLPLALVASKSTLHHDNSPSPLGPRGIKLKATTLQAMELVNDINKDNVFVHLDTHHMNIEESDFSAACKACGDKLRCGKAALQGAVDACLHSHRQHGLCLHGASAAVASGAEGSRNRPWLEQGKHANGPQACLLGSTVCCHIHALLRHFFQCSVGRVHCCPYLTPSHGLGRA